MSKQSELLDSITVRADVFGGKPIVRDVRIAVEHVLGMLVAGDTAETILREYPDLEPQDIQACLRFAHRLVAGELVHDSLPVRDRRRKTIRRGEGVDCAREVDRMGR